MLVERLIWRRRTEGTRLLALVVEKVSGADEGWSREAH